MLDDERFDSDGTKSHASSSLLVSMAATIKRTYPQNPAASTQPRPRQKGRHFSVTILEEVGNERAEGKAEPLDVPPDHIGVLSPTKLYLSYFSTITG
jgi:hypothetical protein